jgi:hypothetical protein
VQKFRHTNAPRTELLEDLAALRTILRQKLSGLLRKASRAPSAAKRLVVPPVTAAIFPSSLRSMMNFL